MFSLLWSYDSSISVAVLLVMLFSCPYHGQILDESPFLQTWAVSMIMFGPSAELAHPRPTRSGCVAWLAAESWPAYHMARQHTFKCFPPVSCLCLSIKTLFHRYTSLKTTFTSNRMFRAARGGLRLQDWRGSSSMELQTGCMRVRRDLIHPGPVGQKFKWPKRKNIAFCIIWCFVF